MNGTIVTVMPEAGGVVTFLSSLTLGQLVEIAIAPSTLPVPVATRFLSAVLMMGTAHPTTAMLKPENTPSVRLPHVVLCEALGRVVGVGENGEVSYPLR